MAFHQPTRQPVHRTTQQPRSDDAAPAPGRTSSRQRSQIDDSSTWVLFEPATEASAASYLCETVQSPGTTGRPPFSDLESLYTLPGTDRNGGASQIPGGSLAELDAVEDDAELDSLDSHLPEFRSFPDHLAASEHVVDQHVQSRFPGHDGLGSFHLNQDVGGLDAQEHIYQFERFNPKRAHHQHESEEAAISQNHEDTPESEKRRWIEAWRTEHGRVLLDQVRRETKRRRQSETSRHHLQSLHERNSLRSEEIDDPHNSQMWHDEMTLDAPPAKVDGTLARMTCTALRDFLGIDDKMLSVLTGASIPDPADLSNRAQSSRAAENSWGSDLETWHTHMVEGISKQLAMLMNQLTHHPGAFSTYMQMHQLHIPYAGLPAIPEIGGTLNIGNNASGRPFAQTSSQPVFNPTIDQPTLQGITPRHSHSPAGEQAISAVNSTFTKDEWERELDIKLVFRYLRSRFGFRSNEPVGAGTPHLATTSTQDTAAKAARVRQHHPLVSRLRPVDRRAFRVGPTAGHVGIRHASSCASQSSRRSTRKSSGSSRHYWDIGGSLGTGSVIASNGPMGSWGEV